MDAHLRYFKLGYELLGQLEPFIHQVLTYAQQSKELANSEQDKLAKRIQEFRTQAEFDSIRASSTIEPSTSVNGTHIVGLSSYKNIEAIMQSAVKGEVLIIKQGYLLKRSSSLRGDCKRRFFVLDNQGTLYYYKNKDKKPVGIQHRSSASVEHNSSVFARFRSRHNRASSVGEGSLGCRIIDLHASTLKMDAEDRDLRLCFRIISPLKTYTLQAENAGDRIDWVNKLTGVIASLFNAQFLQQPHLGLKQMDRKELADGASCVAQQPDSNQLLGDDLKVNTADCVSRILRELPGNDLCAECSAPGPDWASLNLGVLVCIECSGVHRNLGVHISKVRSLTFDVKVWEPTIVDLFKALGNAYCNSVWEGSLLLRNERMDKANAFSSSLLIEKPCPTDAISCRERFIQAKYVEKLLVIRDASTTGSFSHASGIWEAVKTNNLREVYRYIVISDLNIVNTTFNEVVGIESFHHVIDSQDSQFDSYASEKKIDRATCQRINDSKDAGSCLQGCSLLHLACHCNNPVMLELLLQFGANVNLRDFHGRTPLHHCIFNGNYALAKFLLRRGASPSVKDGGGLSVLERAMEMGAITDEKLFLMLAECQ